MPLLWALLGTNFRFCLCQEHVSELVLPFFAFVGPLCTNKCSDTLWAHSGPRGGKTRVFGWLFFGVPGQEVQGGEPPPCPRVALSPDLAVAFHKNGYLPPSAPVVGTIGDKFQVLITSGTCVQTKISIFCLCGPTVWGRRVCADCTVKSVEMSIFFHLYEWLYTEIIENRHRIVKNRQDYQQSSLRKTVRNMQISKIIKNRDNCGKMFVKNP